MVDSAQKRSHSAAAIVGIVLGVIALILSWMPIINNFAGVLGLIGLVFAIVGVVGTARGKKSGKGLAIAALIVNIFAIVIVFGSQMLFRAAIDKAVDGPAPTTNSQGSGSSGGSKTKGKYVDLAAGTAVKLENGLSVTVDSVQTGLANYDGGSVIGVHVTYTNKGKEAADYNTYDWKGEDAQGAQETSTFYSEATEELSSGTLAAGGTVSGNIYFKDGTVKALYFASMFSKKPAASWKLS